MSWLWGSSKPSTSQLDPSLQEFLDKSTKDETATSRTKSQPTYREQLGLSQLDESTPKQPSPQPQDPSSQTVPAEALYQDGRYASLWSNYRSLESLETSQKSDQEKLKDLYDRAEAQKATIIRVANENCSLEEVRWKQCLTSGPWSERMTMCGTDKRRFTRCFEMQQKVLKALGYMAAMNRTELSEGEEMEGREKIQMHADRLYRKMLRRERLRREAEEKGEALPEFKPLVETLNIEGRMGIQRDDATIAKAFGPGATRRPTETPDAPSTAQVPNETPAAPADASEQPTTWSRILSYITPPTPDLTHIDVSDLPEVTRKDFRARLGDRYFDGKITPEQLQIEKEAFKAQLMSDQSLVTGFIDYKVAEKEERKKRWDEGRPTIGDRIKGIKSLGGEN